MKLFGKLIELLGLRAFLEEVCQNKQFTPSASCVLLACDFVSSCSVSYFLPAVDGPSMETWV